MVLKSRLCAVRVSAGHATQLTLSDLTGPPAAAQDAPEGPGSPAKGATGPPSGLEEAPPDPVASAAAGAGPLTAEGEAALAAFGALQDVVTRAEARALAGEVRGATSLDSYSEVEVTVVDSIKLCTFVCASSCAW